MPLHRSRRRVLSAAALAFAGGAGCVSFGGEETERESSPNPKGQTDRATETATPTPSAAVDCSEPVSPEHTDVEGYEPWDPDPPGDLSADESADYVDDFESNYERRAIAARYPEAWSISVVPAAPDAEATDGGYLVYTEVTGYYNRPVEHGTATEHADLYYVASYFLAPNAVFRASDSNRVDPRRSDQAELVLCEPSGE